MANRDMCASRAVSAWRGQRHAGVDGISRAGATLTRLSAKAQQGGDGGNTNRRQRRH